MQQFVEINLEWMDLHYGVDWMFGCLTEEDTLGMAYAQVGQENNFLWENIQPGFELQLSKISELRKQGKVRVETLAETSEWFQGKYQMTPPSNYQASNDWNEQFELKTMWYQCKNYRVSFLVDKKHLSIRDLFVYHEEYRSRYKGNLLTSDASIMDTLPIMFSRCWSEQGERAAIEFLDEDLKPLEIEKVSFSANDDKSARVGANTNEGKLVIDTFEDGFIQEGSTVLYLNSIPELQAIEKNRLDFCHEDLNDIRTVY